MIISVFFYLRSRDCTRSRLCSSLPCCVVYWPFHFPHLTPTHLFFLFFFILFFFFYLLCNIFTTMCDPRFDSHDALPALFMVSCICALRWDYNCFVINDIIILNTVIMVISEVVEAVSSQFGGKERKCSLL